jgi:hypothetical protein
LRPWGWPETSEYRFEGVAMAQATGDSLGKDGTLDLVEKRKATRGLRKPTQLSVTYRASLALLIALPLGCGGRTNAEPDGGGSHAASSGSSRRSGDAGAASGTGSASTSSPGGSDAGADGPASGGRCGVPGIEDAAEIRCADAGTFALYTGGAPYNCEVKPADVACNTTSDCVAYPTDECACVAFAYGVNAACGLACTPPPCPPHACPVTGFLTQDCQLVSSLENVAVDCVDHQCLTRAVAALDAGVDWDASPQCHRDASASPAPQGVCCVGQSDCQVESQNDFVSCCEDHMCAYCGVK